MSASGNARSPAGDAAGSALAGHVGRAHCIGGGKRKDEPMKRSTNKQRWGMTRWPLAIASGLAVLSAACGDDDYYYDPYEDYYAYAYGYPADLAYADAYWVDDWYYPYYTYSFATREKRASNTDVPARFVRDL